MSLKKEEKLDESTFDIVKVDTFHTTRFGTVAAYLMVWLLLIMKLAILGGDTYTCISILVFHRWSSTDYQVYEYKVAKWIFTGCILFRFGLLVWQILWGIRVYRTRNIALAYLNNMARMIYSLRLYDYHCLFHEIEGEGSFEKAAFYVYFELDEAVEILVADLPRQVINIITIGSYATNNDLGSNVLTNIKQIATTNLHLAIILSFQVCTVAIFLFFFVKFVIGMLMFIPVKVKVSNRGFKLFKAICYHLVNVKVRHLVSRNHKPKLQLLAEGMDLADIQRNPLLASSSSLNLLEKDKNWVQLSNMSTMSLDTAPARAHTASSLRYPGGRFEGKSTFMNNVSGLNDPFSDSKESLFRYPRVARSGSASSLAENIPAVSEYYGPSGTLSLPQGAGVAHPRMGRKAPVFEEGPFGDNQALEKPGSLSHSAGLNAVENPFDDNSQSKLLLETQPYGSVGNGLHPSMDDVKSPLLDQEDSAHKDVDSLSIPYPVRGVSQFYEDGSVNLSDLEKNESYDSDMDRKWD